MKESIYTIPISEVFERRRGCPLCALQTALEERWVQYITGPAMMEPDVRLRTNEEGFCGRHLAAMMAQKNRLSVALLLQTRLERLLAQPGPHAAGCFVCASIDGELRRLADNIAAVWKREPAFRQLFAEQQHICLPHHGLLYAANGLRGRARKDFLAAADALLRKGLAPAKANIDAFCGLFDYRSEGGPPSEAVAGAVGAAAALLCGPGFAEKG